ncbi:TLDc domain-containing protein [Entamoeba marina]
MSNLSLDILKSWSGKSSCNIIFDSDIIGNGKITLPSIVMNKSHLYFIHIDGNNNIFGGYIENRIEYYDTYISDENSFMFSLMKEGKVVNRKYNIKTNCSGMAFCLMNSRDCLYIFGAIGKFLRCLSIYRIGHNNPYSRACCYDFNNENFPFFTNLVDKYPLLRILVIEMN